MTGTARRKLNSAAAAAPRPPHTAAHTVAQVPGARDRQELGESLHQSQHDPLPQRHAIRPATSATIPTSIAPFSSRLLRALCPANRRLATASTASWANSAMRKYAPP